MKYIVLTDNNNFSEIMITFPSFIQHVKMFGIIKNENTYAVIVSAGSIRFTENERLECYGESHSLKVKSREKVDTELLLFNLGK